MNLHAHFCTSFLVAACPAALAQSFGPEQAISTTTDGAISVFAADLDGDGDTDVLSASREDHTIAWFENLGAGSFGLKRIISNSALGAHWVSAADLDGDGDADVLATSTGDNIAGWYENLGQGQFGSRQAFSSTQVGVNNIIAADFTGDGRPEVLVTYLDNGNGLVELHKNLGGGTFAAGQIVIAAGFDTNSIFPADLDNDGDLDILGASAQGVMFTLENVGGGFPLMNVPFAKEFALVPPTICAADIDGDGDLDPVVTTISGVSWHENLTTFIDGLPTYLYAPGPPHGNGLTALTTDIDKDGDPDILSATSLGIGVYENLGGGTFLPYESILATADLPFSLAVADLDGDVGTDFDLIASSLFGDKIMWFENLSFKDCNGNGVHDVTDIAAGTSTDCNGNGVPDECDALGPHPDVDGDGQLDICVAPPLMADTYELSVSAGGVQTFTLTAPTPFDFYFLLGTASGSSPGSAAGALTVPLNTDAYLLHTLTQPNLPPLTSSFGVLLPGGTGGHTASSFTLPPASSPTLIGLTLHHAYVTIGFQSGSLNFASNAVPLALQP